VALLQKKNASLALANRVLSRIVTGDCWQETIKINRREFWKQESTGGEGENDVLVVENNVEK
jgi:hypothetical protein